MKEHWIYDVIDDCIAAALAIVYGVLSLHIIGTVLKLVGVIL